MMASTLRGLRPLLAPGFGEGAERGSGGHGGGDGLVPLVLVGAREARTVEGLFFVVAGQEPKADGYAGVDGDLGEALGHALAHIVEMRGAAADDDSEGDDGVVAALG